jgi:WD40 repeat protein
MRRYGVLFAGLVVVVLLAGTCYVAQRISDAEQGLVLKKKFDDHEHAVYTADFDEKEELVTSGGFGGFRVWRLNDAHEIYHRPGRIYLTRFLKDGNFLCADANEGIILLDRKTWQVRKRFGQPSASIVAAASYAGDKIAASFSHADNEDTDPPMCFEIHVWQLVENEWRESILRGHQGPVLSLDFHPDAPQLVSFGLDLTTRVWDLSNATQIDQAGETTPHKIHVSEEHSACAFSPSGDRLLVNGSIWDYAKDDEKPIRKSTEQKLGGRGARCAMFSPDGRWIAAGYKDGALHLWDSKTLVERAVVKGSINGSPLNEVRFSRSGKLIVTAGMGIVPGFAAMGQKVKADDTVVRVWRVNIPD